MIVMPQHPNRVPQERRDGQESESNKWMCVSDSAGTSMSD